MLLRVRRGLWEQGPELLQTPRVTWDRVHPPWNSFTGKWHLLHGRVGGTGAEPRKRLPLCGDQEKGPRI